MIKKEYDLLIVGAGIYMATAAYEPFTRSTTNVTTGYIGNTRNWPTKRRMLRTVGVWQSTSNTTARQILKK